MKNKLPGICDGLFNQFLEEEQEAQVSRSSQFEEANELQQTIGGTIGSQGIGLIGSIGGLSGTITKPWGPGPPVTGIGFQGPVGGGQLNLGVIKPIGVPGGPSINGGWQGPVGGGRLTVGVGHGPGGWQGQGGRVRPFDEDKNAS